MAFERLIPLVEEGSLPAVDVQRAASSFSPPISPVYGTPDPRNFHPLRVQGMDPLREKFMRVGDLTQQALSNEAFAMRPQNRGELASMMQIRANRTPMTDASTGREYMVGTDYANGGRRFGVASLPPQLGNEGVLQKFAEDVAPSLMVPNSEVGKYGITKTGTPWMSWKGTYNADTMSSPFEGGRPEPAYVAPTTPTQFPSMEWKSSTQAGREDYLENTWSGARKSANDLAAQLVSNRMVDPGYDATPAGQALISKGQGLTGKLIGAQQKEVARQANMPLPAGQPGHYPMREQAYGRNFMSPIYGETTDSIMEDYYKRAAAPGRYGVESFPNAFLDNMHGEWVANSPALTEIETVHPAYTARYKGVGMEPGYYKAATRGIDVDPITTVAGTRPEMVSQQMYEYDKYPEGWGEKLPYSNIQTLAQEHAAALESGNMERANRAKALMDERVGQDFNAVVGSKPAMLSLPSETELGVYPPSRPGESGKYLIGNVPQRIADPSSQVLAGTQFYREVPVAPRGQGEYYNIASQHEAALSGTPVTTYERGGVRIPGRPSRTSRIDNSRALMSGIELKPVTTIKGGLVQEAADRGFAPNSDEAIRLELGSRANSNHALVRAADVVLEPIKPDLSLEDVEGMYRQGQLDNLRRQQMDPGYRAWQATPNDARQVAVENLRQEAIQRQNFNNAVGARGPVQLSIPEVAAIPNSTSPSVAIAPRMMDVPSGGGYRLPEGYGAERQLAIPGLHEEMSMASRNAQADSLRTRAAKLMRMKGLA